MSAVTWRAGVAIDGVTGTTPLQVTDDDWAAQATRPAPGELRLLAPFTIGETTDDQLWPAQPRGYGRFSLLANSAAELAGIVRGVQVHMGWKTNRDPAHVGDPDHVPPIPAVPWDIRLPGIIDTAKLRPWWSGGVVGEFTVVDYRIGLLGTDSTGTADWPSEDHATRLARILGTNGLDWVGVAPTPAVDPNMIARSASRTTKLDAAEATLREWVDIDGASNVVGRPVIVAGLTGGTVDTSGLSRFFLRWSVVRQERANDPTSTTKVVTPDGTTGAPGQIELTAGLVEFASASWEHAPSAQPTKVAATWSNGGVQTTNASANADHVPGGVTEVIETQLQANVAANRVVNLYLPDAGLSRWAADTFAYWLDRADADNPTIARCGQVVVITDLSVDDNPDAAEVYSGRVQTAELTVEAGQVAQAITLLPAVSTVVTSLDGLDAPATSWALSLDGLDAPATSWAATYDGGTA